MSDHIPFEIQSEIIKMLPVKSLIQFRSVSKQWKAFIDNPEFIKTYQVNHTNPQHRLLVKYDSDIGRTYTSIDDNNTFPHHKFPLTAPESLRSFRDAILLSSVNGLLCFYDLYGNVDPNTNMIVIWNPTVRKSVGIGILVPEDEFVDEGYIVVGFGVCPDTSHPKLVKINLDKLSNMWVVEVFTLSTRVWRTVYTGAPYKSCDLSWFQVFVDGVIYFRAYDNVFGNLESRFNFVISFDIKSEKFGEVCLPDRLVHTPHLELTKMNESLGLLEYHHEGGMGVFGVWIRKDGANNPFTKLYTIKVEGKLVFRWVLGFRNNGEVVVELDDDNNEKSGIGVYEPFSGRINDVGINGKQGTLYASSYMETLLLLDEADSIIH